MILFCLLTPAPAAAAALPRVRDYFSYSRFKLLFPAATAVPTREGKCSECPLMRLIFFLLARMNNLSIDTVAAPTKYGKKKKRKQLLSEITNQLVEQLK